MKKVNLLLCLLLIINVFTAKNLISQESNTLSKEEAKTVGTNFFKQISNSEATRAGIIVENQQTIKSESGSDAIHIINYRNGGYVLVSTSKNAYPILSFSEEGNFDISNMNPAAKMWIDSYAEQIDYISKNSIESNEMIDDAWASLTRGDVNSNTRHTKSLEPIVKTKWNQNYPYNKFCPPATNGPKGHVYAGCVATTMAQIMKFWNYPESSQGSKTYHWGTDITEDLNVSYDWKNMPLSTSVANKDQVDEIAKLIYNCAITVNMNFSGGSEGSGASISRCPNAFKNYFKYNSGMKIIENDPEKVTQDEWKRYLIEDLDKGHPIFYAGTHSKSNFGHAFVCDGYKNDLYFHFNFGWSGSGDGFYYVDKLNSKFEEIKSDSVINHFNISQMALFNITPKGATFCEKLTYTQPNWTFDDGSGPNFYQNNSNCQWQINIVEPIFSKLKINFNRFDLSDTDVLRIYEGNGTDGNLIGEYNKDNQPGVITTSSRNVHFNFVTNDNGQAMGWEVSYESTMFESNSIEENIFDNVSLYPNPVTNILNIKGVDFDSNISIHDVCGKIIYSENNMKNESIDLSSFAKGIYFVKLSSDNGSKTFKIVKE